jgi:hypothetical protein
MERISKVHSQRGGKKEREREHERKVGKNPDRRAKTEIIINRERE